MEFFDENVIKNLNPFIGGVIDNTLEWFLKIKEGGEIDSLSKSEIDDVNVFLDYTEYYYTKMVNREKLELIRILKESFKKIP